MSWPTLATTMAGSPILWGVRTTGDLLHRCDGVIAGRHIGPIDGHTCQGIETLPRGGRRDDRSTRRWARAPGAGRCARPSQRAQETTAEERIDQITAELRLPGGGQGSSVKESAVETARRCATRRAAGARGKDQRRARGEFRAATRWFLLSPPVVVNGLIWLVPVAALAAGLVFATGRLRTVDAPPKGAEPSATQVAALRERVAREEAAEG